MLKGGPPPPPQGVYTMSKEQFFTALSLRFVHSYACAVLFHYHARVFLNMF